MKYYVSNEDVSVRIFRSSFLEWFTHVHPVVPHVIYVPVIGYMLYASHVQGTLVDRIGWLFLGGLLLWTLVEYLVHRFAFHATPQVEEEAREAVRRLASGEAALPRLTSWRQKQYFLAHGVHHDFPNDSRRLVMPPSVSIPLAVVFFTVLRLLLGAGDGPALFAGFAFGYLIYDTIHYAVHHFSLRRRIMLYLKKHHFRHHYKDPTKDYGVSNPFWDVVLRTLGRAGPQEVQTPAGT